MRDEVRLNTSAPRSKDEGPARGATLVQSSADSIHIVRRLRSAAITGGPVPAY